MSIPSYTIERILNYCRAKKYVLHTKPEEINIIYVEGMNTDGKLNNDEPNQFNDVRMVLDFQLRLLGCWSATTEPGRWYTEYPMNIKGAARIAFGQYQAWQVGIHKDHQALVQATPITVHRDRNKDGLRTGDAIYEGLFGVNQHWGYDLPIDNIGKASAGCLVGRSRQGHREFMTLVKSDCRYKDKNYIFTTIVVPGNEL